jgi:hypothetical protein
METAHAKETGTGDIVVSLTPDKRIPDALHAELARMRRAPDGFSVVRMVKCSMGCGKAKAYSLTHADSVNAGTWCAVHGWLYFDSVALPPTERLTTSEITERQLEQKRKRKTIQKGQPCTETQ